MCLNPLTPVSDQDRISPYYIYIYNIMQTSDENKEKILIMGLLINPILISPNKLNESHLIDSEEN